MHFSHKYVRCSSGKQLPPGANKVNCKERMVIALLNTLKPNHFPFKSAHTVMMHSNILTEEAVSVNEFTTLTASDTPSLSQYQHWNTPCQTPHLTRHHPHITSHHHITHISLPQHARAAPAASPPPSYTQSAYPHPPRGYATPPPPPRTSPQFHHPPHLASPRPPRTRSL